MSRVPPVATLLRSGVRAAAAGVLAGVLAGTLTGCGGDDPPTSASEADFCEAYNSLFAEGGLEDASDEEIIEEIKAWGRRLEETGTPRSMPEQARAGFEETVARLESLSPEDGRREVERLEEEAGAEARTRMAAFDEFSMQACGPPVEEGLPGDPQ